MGIDMADELRVVPANAKGHWERWEIVEFHDRILELFNRGYFGPFHDFPLPVAWWADPRVHQIKGKIVAFLKQRMGENDFGFKDPRTVRLMPLWHQIFNDLKLVPKIVLCLRNPAQVARSLKARDGIDIDIGEYRSLVHTADFFRYSGGFDVCTVEYEEWFRDPFANFERLRAFLDLQWQQSETDLGLVLSGIIDPALRHDSSDPTAATHPLVRSLYEVARGTAGARRSGGHTDIVSQFVTFQRLQEPFQRAFEHAADIAAKVPPLEQEVAALRSAVAERDALIEAANSRTSAAEGRVAEVLSETEVLRARLDETARERDGNAAALEEVQSRLAERESVLKDALGRADELAALLKSSEQARAASLAEFEAQKVCVTALSDERDALSATTAELQSEIETLRTKLADERDTLTATTGELQSEIQTLRAAIAAAEQRESKNHSAISSLQEEISSLGTELENAERRARAGETAAATRQAEITSLRAELDAARDIGKAALASLRVTPAPILPPQRSAGWVKFTLRRLGDPLRHSSLSPG
jgi:hypothetical protein